MRADKILFYITMAVIYSLIVGIALYTPMHSDDFSYSFLGILPSDHIKHYMTWSGRIVADYVSTIILGLNNHFLIAVINSVGSVLLIFNITKLSLIFNKNSNKHKETLILIFVFLLYWLGNPNLGQVMFWVVGTANYTWTTLIVIYFLRKNIEIRENKNVFPIGTIKTVAMFFLGILAGCSNENTSISLVIFMLMLLLYYKFSYGKFGNAVASSFLGVVIGSSALILAPGNYVRANLPLLDDWRNSSLLTRFINFINNTIPDVMSHNWLAFLCLIIIFFGVILSESINKKTIYLSLGLLVLFILSNAAMIASPWYPPRSMNPQFIFLVCMSSTLMALISGRFLYHVYIFIILFLMIFFIPNYISTFIAYKHAYIQSEMRVDIINSEKNNGHTSAEIPLFHFRTLMNDGFKFDTWHSNAIAKYYGLEKVAVTPVNFDYSIIREKCSYHTNMVINGSKIKCIYVYYDEFKSESYFITEIDKKIIKNEDQDIRLFIKPTLVNGKTITRNTGFKFQTESVGDRNFTFLKIKNIRPDDVKFITLGYYSSKTGHIYKSEVIENN